jgi:hypothetical protein
MNWYQKQTSCNDFEVEAYKDQPQPVDRPLCPFVFYTVNEKESDFAGIVRYHDQDTLKGVEVWSRSWVDIDLGSNWLKRSLGDVNDTKVTEETFRSENHWKRDDGAEDSGGSAHALQSVVQQNLTNNPPLPIIELSNRYILAALEFANKTLASNSSLPSRYQSTSASLTSSLATPAASDAVTKRHLSPLTSNAPNTLLKRDGPETCGANAPCADGSCCNGNGLCGYGPDYCSTTAGCISNCDGEYTLLWNI